MDRRMFRYKRQENAAKQAPKDEGMTVQAAISAVQARASAWQPVGLYDLEKVNEKPTEECFKEALKHTVLQCHKVRVDVDDMRRCLAQGNPIICGLMLTDPLLPSRPGRLHSNSRRKRPKSGATWHACFADRGVQ